MHEQIAIGGIRTGGENGQVLYGCVIGEGLHRQVDSSGWDVFLVTTVTQDEVVMLLNKDLLPEQLQVHLSAIAHNPGCGIELPPNMPFWVKHQILTTGRL